MHTSPGGGSAHRLRSSAEAAPASQGLKGTEGSRSRVTGDRRRSATAGAKRPPCTARTQHAVLALNLEAHANRARTPPGGAASPVPILADSPAGQQGQLGEPLGSHPVGPILKATPPGIAVRRMTSRSCTPPWVSSGAPPSALPPVAVGEIGQPPQPASLGGKRDVRVASGYVHRPIVVRTTVWSPVGLASPWAGFLPCLSETAVNRNRPENARTCGQVRDDASPRRLARATNARATLADNMPTLIFGR